MNMKKSTDKVKNVVARITFTAVWKWGRVTESQSMSCGFMGAYSAAALKEVKRQMLSAYRKQIEASDEPYPGAKLERLTASIQSLECDNLLNYRED